MINDRENPFSPEALEKARKESHPDNVGRRANDSYYSQKKYSNYDDYAPDDDSTPYDD